YDWAIASRGRTYLAMERYEEALADFTTAIDLDPDDPSFRHFRAMIGSEETTNKDRYQWVASMEGGLSEASSLARLAADWLISEGIITTERSATGAYLPDGQYAMEQSAGSQPANTRRIMVHQKWIVCYPMKADMLICPSCGNGVPLLKDGLPTRAWSKIAELADNWGEGNTLWRECAHCSHRAQLHEWQFDPPWAFCQFALCLWNWEPADLAFIDRLSTHLGCRLALI
ncbi:tetratricopeptide repeat protein, partial [Acrocarpospora corrugata]